MKNFVVSSVLAALFLVPVTVFAQESKTGESQISQEELDVIVAEYFEICAILALADVINENNEFLEAVEEFSWSAFINRPPELIFVEWTWWHHFDESSCANI